MRETGKIVEKCPDKSLRNEPVSMEKPGTGCMQDPASPEKLGKEKRWDRKECKMMFSDIKKESRCICQFFKTGGKKITEALNCNTIHHIPGLQLIRMGGKNGYRKSLEGNLPGDLMNEPTADISGKSWIIA
jgi:hypothetical protein